MIRNTAIAFTLMLVALQMGNAEPGNNQRELARGILNDAQAGRITGLKARQQIEGLDAEVVIPVLQEMAMPSDEAETQPGLAFTIAARPRFAETTSGTLLLLQGLENENAAIRSVSAVGLRSAPDNLRAEAGEALLDALKAEKTESVKNSILLALRSLPGEAQKGIGIIVQVYHDNPQLRNAPSTLAQVATAQEWFAAVKGVSPSGKLIDLETDIRPAILGSVARLSVEKKYVSLSDVEKSEVFEFVMDSLHSDEEAVRSGAFEASALIVLSPPIESTEDLLIVQAWREQAKQEANAPLKLRLERAIEGATASFQN